MDAHIFQAALICELCTESFTAAHPMPAHVNPADESSYDSDEWPKGPYGNGGGEADTPQHCDHCGVFLDNPLTQDGSIYVKDAWHAYCFSGQGRLDVLRIWRDEYPNEWAEWAGDSETSLNGDRTLAAAVIDRWRDLADD